LTVLLIRSFTKVPAGPQSYTVVNIIVFNAGPDHEDDSVVEETLEKLRLSNYGLIFKKATKNRLFQF
jgi:hypothetical protein